MSVHLSLYDILGLSATAAPGEIKSAFRKSALRNHPDRNNNSSESAARFRVIYNAYSVLSDAAKRREYDAYLKTSSIFGKSDSYPAAAGTNRNRQHIPSTIDTLATLLNHLNYILWDIEDLLHAKPDWNRTFDGLPLHEYVFRILSFIEKWILDAAGFPDYFFEARRISVPSKAALFSAGRKTGHRPFVSLDDYFYNIRLRTDKFLNRAKLIDFLEPVPGTKVHIIDCVFEAHNYGVHYLGCLKSALAGEIESIPPFQYTDSCFDA